MLEVNLPAKTHCDILGKIQQNWLWLPKTVNTFCMLLQFFPPAPSFFLCAMSTFSEHEAIMKCCYLDPQPKLLRLDKHLLEQHNTKQKSKGLKIAAFTCN